jgi:hypothetical protein
MIVLLVVLIAVVVLALAIGFGGFGGFGAGYSDGPVVHRRIIRRRPPVRRIITEEHVTDDYDPAYRP